MTETKSSELVAAEDPLERGRDAFARHDWREAFEHLGAADRAGGLPPEDLERLAEAAFWSSHLPVSLDAWERAYTAYLEAGNQRRAGFMSLRLFQGYSDKLQASVAMGWLKRAERLLAEVPDSAEHGWLVLIQAAGARARGDVEGALERARLALDAGTRTGDRDLQALSLHTHGHLLVTQGDVTEGMAMIDEATVAAVSGELGAMATAIVYCRTISTCRDLADYRRAGEWTDAAQRWCQRQAISGFPGICRIHRAEVMRFRGAWVDAEREVRRACGELLEFSPESAGEAFHELGEIRLRVGDLEGAADAFRQAHELGREPEPGLSLLRLAEGRPDAAAASIRRVLVLEPSDRLTRARLLPAAVEIALAAGDVERARSAAGELEGIATTYGTPALQALAACAAGAVRLEDGDAAAALPGLKRGWQIWKELDAPYEAARARMLLVAAYQSLGDRDACRMELEAARAAFERLGAAPDERRASQRLAELEAADTRAATPTRREALTFMFTDIEGSTSLLEAIGDEAWAALLHWHDLTLRTLFAAHGGEEIKQAGDGFFVGFADPASAVECAVAIQRTLAEHRRSHGFAPQVRIGLHATEADRRGTDFGGKGVHEAARITMLARGGEILASEATLGGAEELRSRHAVSDSRQVALKGLSQPVPVVAVEWREAGSGARG